MLMIGQMSLDQMLLQQKHYHNVRYIKYVDDNDWTNVFRANVVTIKVLASKQIRV
jgi:hypothetical protein